VRAAAVRDGGDASLASVVDHPYPAHWEADVVLRDGGTAHLRPIRPDDADRLRRFHARLSDETIYFRFFSLYRELSEKDMLRFTVVDQVDRVALVATVGGEMIGVVRYERTGPHEAEVAFNIEDAHQGRGLGSVFLEHIAAAAREHGIGSFLADVLPNNRKMLRVFQDAGYVVRQDMEEGVVRLGFDLEPTENSRSVTQDREHRAEARSVQRLLRPATVVVVGASRSEHSIGRTVLRHIVEGGFTGTVYVVNPHADEVGGVRSYARVTDVPTDVDLAVVAVAAEQVEQVVAECAVKGVRGLVVVSSGFAEVGEQGRERQRRLVRLARGSGMRVVGPSSFGLLVTDPDVSLNASLSPVMPPRGRVGFFSQSGALGVAILDSAASRGLGISSFVSAGNRVDVSGNDLMQFWEDDAGTDAVMLYLESLGNPRKFSRVARRLSRRKPVVAVKSARAHSSAPHGHVVRESAAPAAAVEALFRQAGVIRVDTIHTMFDVGALVAHQSLPGGRRVAILGNSDALAMLAADACVDAGLVVAGEPRQLGAQATAPDFAAALAEVLADDGVDSVVALFSPPLQPADEEVATVLAQAAARADKTVVSTFLGMPGIPDALRAAGVAADGRECSVPSYPTPEDAVRALAAVTDYAQWRRTPAGNPVEPSGLDVRAARAFVARTLGDAESLELGQEQQRELLACYGIALWDARRAATVEQAVAAAADLGYPVALKTTAGHLRHRSDLGAVRLDIDDERGLRAAYDAMALRLGPGGAAHFVLQRMAPVGVATVVASVEDPSFGPVVSFGVGGVATELLDDRAYGIPPLTDDDLRGLVRGVRAAPLLFGHRGSPPVDTARLEDLIARLARLADDLPDVAQVELNPVLVGVDGLAVLAASCRLVRSAGRTDRGARALLG
jgi:acyl-CoA synthetase (NDP forming)/RimJ/RimL family protein N-acetyltransferase